MSTDEQPAPAYGGVEHENDPGQGTAIAEQAPAESGTLSTAADEREGAGSEPSTGATPTVPGSEYGDRGFPSGSTDTPPADTGGSAVSGGVSGLASGHADLEDAGGTGLTTADTEGGDR